MARMKTNTVYRVEQECEIPGRGNVLRGQVISLPALRKAGEEPVLFRRVKIWDAEKRESIVFLSSLLHLAAATIAAIYKDRRQVELFKVLKQTLKVKTVPGIPAPPATTGRALPTRRPDDNTLSANRFSAPRSPAATCRCGMGPRAGRLR